MRKCLKIAALVLVLALVLCTTAFAANYEVKGDGYVVFASDTTLNVSFTNDVIQDGRDYMIWVIAGTDDGEGNTMYIPTQTSVLYIGQAAAVGSTFAFEGVYPKEITASAVMISGPGISDLDETGLYILGTIEKKETPSYKIGDPNEDGYVTAADASKVLRVVVGLEKNLPESVMSAADANQDGYVTAADASKILRVVVGLETL